MHEALAYAGYEVDTSVVDEPAPPIARSRTVTDGALTMQVYIEKWHRRIPTLSHTACGLSIHGEFNDTRREQLHGDLCTECFTGFELTLAATNNRKDRDP